MTNPTRNLQSPYDIRLRSKALVFRLAGLIGILFLFYGFLVKLCPVNLKLFISILILSLSPIMLVRWLVIRQMFKAWVQLLYLLFVVLLVAMPLQSFFVPNTGIVPALQAAIGNIGVLLLGAWIGSLLALRDLKLEAQDEIESHKRLGPNDPQ